MQNSKILTTVARTAFVIGSLAAAYALLGALSSGSMTGKAEQDKFIMGLAPIAVIGGVVAIVAGAYLLQQNRLTRTLKGGDVSGIGCGFLVASLALLFYLLKLAGL